MRPPKLRTGVQGSSDPPQLRHQLFSNQIREAPAMVAEIRRICESVKPLPGTSGKVDVPGLEKRMDGFRVRQHAGTQKVADALRSRHVPGIEGQNKNCEAQLPKKVQLANGQKKMCEAQLHKKVQLANGQKVKCEAQLPKKVQLENVQNNKCEAQLHKKVQLANVQNKKCEAQSHKKVQLAKGDSECNKYYHQGSSSSAPTQITMDCCICMQSKPFFNFFPINGCKHSYCSKCVGSYIEAMVNMNVTLIRCPDPACKDGKFEPLTCKLMITKKVFDRWCDALSESTVRVKFYCPFKDCSALLIDERGQEVMQESECPHCHRLFCAHCSVPWHSGLSCREFLKMEKFGKEKNQDKMLKELAQKSKWQRCPKCKFYVERISGCMFIKCRCGSNFCYGCASEMEVDHYCQKCKR